MIEVEKPRWVLSRHLSFAAALASVLARDREQDKVGVPEFLACCYIADPIRFLSFWTDALDCIEALRLDCGLLDPVVLYQHSLLVRFRSDLETQDGIVAFYAEDLNRYLLDAAEAQQISDGVPRIDLPNWLLVVRSDLRLSRVFKAGFRIDIARQRASVIA